MHKMRNGRMVKKPEGSNKNNLLRCEKSEDPNQENLFSQMVDSNQHGPNPQECVGNVKIMKTDLRF